MSVFIMHWRPGAAIVLAAFVAACSAPAESNSMKNKTDEPAQPVALDAQLNVAYYASGEPERLAIHYRVDNASALPISILDTAASKAADPPRPTFNITGDGDLTVAFKLHAPRRGELAVPRNVYATQVAPGEHYTAQLTVALLSVYPSPKAPAGAVRPARVRFCQAYAVHSDEGFTPLADDADVWLAQPGLHASQEVLCSAWVALKPA